MRHAICSTRAAANRLPANPEESTRAAGPACRRPTRAAQAFPGGLLGDRAGAMDRSSVMHSPTLTSTQVAGRRPCDVQVRQEWKPAPAIHGIRRWLPHVQFPSSQRGCGWDRSAGPAGTAAARMPLVVALTGSAQPATWSGQVGGTGESPKSRDVSAVSRSRALPHWLPISGALGETSLVIGENLLKDRLGGQDSLLRTLNSSLSDLARNCVLQIPTATVVGRGGLQCFIFVEQTSVSTSEPPRITDELLQAGNLPVSQRVCQAGHHDGQAEQVARFVSAARRSQLLLERRSHAVAADSSHLFSLRREARLQRMRVDLQIERLV